MRPRPILRRLLPRSSSNLPFFRTFTHNTPIRSRPSTRPRLPFLSIPVAGRQRVRYLTTEHKQVVKQGLKFGVFFYFASMAFAAVSWAVQQENLEREYPTPHGWSYRTRIYFRNARLVRDDKDAAPNWEKIIEIAELVVKRLEDPACDGKGVRDAPHECPPGTKDVSGMEEDWRRGYFESMMLYAEAAQMMHGWMRDKTRDIMFPPEVIIGPSNPRPRPIRPGSASAPREEDCEFVYPSADDIYMRIVCTKGFTVRQKMEAALAHASWLEYNHLIGPASIMYERAVDLALEGDQASPTNPSPVDTKSWAIKEISSPTRPPSENLLTSLTALATFQARSGNVSSALPLLISLLQARKSLPLQPPNQLHPRKQPQNITTSLINLVKPPSYPPPPPSGTQPPVRDAKELCEEAALHLHIGEILYASRSASREEGLAWTRDAVDLAEEQLRRLGPDAEDALKPAKLVCRSCLAAGLENWTAMVAKLAEEEKSKKPTAEGGKAGWFGGLWGEGMTRKEDVDRWAAEGKVIEERQRRAAELLEEVEPPKGLFDFKAIFQV